MSDIKEIQQFLVAEGVVAANAIKPGIMDKATSAGLNSLREITQQSNFDKIKETYNNMKSEIMNQDTQSEVSSPAQGIQVSHTVSKTSITPAAGGVSPNYYQSTNMTLTQSKSKRLSARSLFKYDHIPCLLVNLRTGAVVDFGLESPQSISETTSASYDDTTPRGRSHPFKSYNSSEGRNISFDLSLHEDYCKDGLKDTINKIKATTYPIAKGDQLVSPLCLLILGDMIKIKCVINSVDITWEKPYRDKLYLAARVSLTMSEIVDQSVMQQDVEGGK